MTYLIVAIIAGTLGACVGVVIGMSLAIENLKKRGAVVRDKVGDLRLLKKHGRRQSDRDRHN